MNFKIDENVSSHSIETKPIYYCNDKSIYPEMIDYIIEKSNSVYLHKEKNNLKDEILNQIENDNSALILAKDYQIVNKSKLFTEHFIHPDLILFRCSHRLYYDFDLLKNYKNFDKNTEEQNLIIGEIISSGIRNPPQYFYSLIEYKRERLENYDFITHIFKDFDINISNNFPKTKEQTVNLLKSGNYNNFEMRSETQKKLERNL